uniref:peptidylprolyl isomerase n=1 Tax=Candidozyma auris TaxID=498019 RepID=A0A0L0NNS5_CANAR
MSVLFETEKGNLVIDVDHRKFSRISFQLIALCYLNHWLLSDFTDFTKDVSIKSPSTAVPSNIKTLLENKEFKDDHDEDSHLAAPGSVEFTGSEDEFQFQINLSAKQSSQVFGRVAEGLTVLDDVNKGTGGLKILHCHVVYDPFSVKGFADQRKNEDSLLVEEIKSRLQSQTPSSDDSVPVEALALELLGDLSHYQVKPSPRTLFVARLNPITSENSLEVIFARFGPIKKVQILAGKKIRYAFVEFVQQEDAEQAYAKLHDNCYIDGHQILVDFSQSTRHLQN